MASKIILKSDVKRVQESWMELIDYNLSPAVLLMMRRTLVKANRRYFQKPDDNINVSLDVYVIVTCSS